MNYKMTLQYEGTRYDGWQKQGNTDRTIQGKLEQVLSRLAGEKVEVQGAGRTDAGVHALQQTASFRMDTELSEAALAEYINRYLPEDVAVTGLEQAPPRFHARLSARWKTYSYRLSFGPRKPVFDRKLVCCLEREPDFEKIRKAAEMLEGTHDFRAFCANKHMKKSTVRTIYEIRLQLCREEGRASICYSGDGFLYHMVRILTGTLLEIGWGKRRPEEIKEILESRDRSRAGFTAPASGLFLEEVGYEPWQKRTGEDRTDDQAV